MKEEGFAYGFDPTEVEKIKRELEDLEEKISRAEKEYHSIEHGPANQARMRLEQDLSSLREQRKKLKEELFSIGLSEDMTLRRIFRDDPESGDFIQ